MKEQATLVFRLESSEEQFLSLKAQLTVRAGVFGSKVSVYAGDSEDHADMLVREIAETGSHEIDLTSLAKGKKALYVKLLIAETAFDWGGIVSVRFRELTTQSSAVKERTVYETDIASQTVCSDDTVCNDVSQNAGYQVRTDGVLVRADKAMYGKAEISAGQFVNAIRGFYQGKGGPDGTWPMKEQATLVFRLESSEEQFLGLKAQLTVRAGVFGSKVSVYTGDSEDHTETLVRELTDSGNYEIDLTNHAFGSKVVYVKIVIAETAFDWGGLVSAKFKEKTSP